MGIRFLFIPIFLIASIQLESRPISYSGGSTLMLQSEKQRDTLYYHYSPTYKFSVGIQAVKDKYFNENYSYLRFTYLLNRKNTPHSQRNLYLQSGISSNGFDNHFYGMHGDWETRRWFSGFGYKKTESQKLNFVERYLQIGVAPYVGEYGDLHTWIMLKSKNNSIADKWEIYPVLKFFKGNALLEFGYSNSLNWDVHLMYRF